jgi:hypothetical protein
MIYFNILLLFIFTTIFAMPRLPSPRVVYSAVIYNKQDSPVDCNILWLTPLSATLDSSLLTVGVNNYYAVNETTANMGSWTARKIIQSIHCGGLVLDAPFPKVHSPSLNWQFDIEPDQIVSVGRSSHVF